MEDRAMGKHKKIIFAFLVGWAFSMVLPPKKLTSMFSGKAASA
jgi:hypothetical protein